MSIMKKQILQLILAHAVATCIALLSDSGVYTMMFLYAIQTTIFLLLKTIQGLRYSSLFSKTSVGTLFFVFGSQLAFIFVFLILLPGSSITNDGVTKTIELGTLSILPLVSGSISFLVDYVLDAKQQGNQYKNDFVHSISTFLIMFGHLASLIIILFVALSWSLQQSIVFIAIVKTCLDISVILLTNGAKKIDRLLKIKPIVKN